MVTPRAVVVSSLQTALLETCGPAGTARAEVVPAQLLKKFLVAVDERKAALDFGFGWESPSTFATWLERQFGFHGGFSYQMDLPLTSEMEAARI